MAGSKLEDLCKYLQQNKEKNYPIGNAALVDLSDYLVTEYFTILAIVLQQGNANELQLSFYKRLLAGVDTSLQIDEMMRKAVNIEIQDYLSFVDDFKESPLRFRIVLDALILSALERNSDEQVEMITYFVESLQITTLELDYLIRLAEVILSQDEAKYVELRDKCPKRISMVAFFEYLELFMRGIVVNNEDHFIAIGDVDQETVIDYSEGLKITSKDVYIRNIVFRSKYSYGGITFKCKKLKVEKTKFRGTNESIHIHSCENAMFEDCSFMNYKISAIHFHFLGDVHFKRCKFENCIKYYIERFRVWTALGGVILVGNDEYSKTQKYNIRTILIDECVFENCGGCNEEYESSNSIISNNICKVTNSRFYLCRHYYGTKEPRQEREDRNSDVTLFSSDSKGENNEIIDSAKFN